MYAEMGVSRVNFSKYTQNGPSILASASLVRIFCAATPELVLLHTLLTGSPQKRNRYTQGGVVTKV